jgi:hypothetical protein
MGVDFVSKSFRSIPDIYMRKWYSKNPMEKNTEKNSKGDDREHIFVS